MESSSPLRILVVTDRTAASGEMLSTIAERARRGRVSPPRARAQRGPGGAACMHPEPSNKAAEAELVLAEALPAILSSLPQIQP
jgi:hypothetical protein